jgi:hypothetical protein
LRHIPPDLVASLPKLYDAALGTDRWTAALDAIAEMVPAKGVMAHAFGREESPYSASLSN